MKTIFDVDKKITTYFITNVTPIKNDLPNISTNKETYASIIGLAFGCHAIKIAILTAAKDKNTYAANILLRSLIEHYTKFIYITYRYSKDNNNNVGQENLFYQKAVEVKSYGSALDFYKSLFNKDYEKVNMALAVTKLSPEAAGKSAATLNMIDRQFKYRSIIKFFNENEIEFFKSQADIFPPMVVQYSELSSFTHGGAWANEFGSDTSKEYINYLRETVIMTVASVYSLTCLALSRSHPNFIDIHEKINSEVNSIASA